jgi:hypothetical protein
MVQQQLQIIAAEFDAMAMTVEGKPASQGPTDPKQSWRMLGGLGRNVDLE